MQHIRVYGVDEAGQIQEWGWDTSYSPRWYGPNRLGAQARVGSTVTAINNGPNVSIQSLLLPVSGATAQSLTRQFDRFVFTTKPLPVVRANWYMIMAMVGALESLCLKGLQLGWYSYGKGTGGLELC
jgi:hypothetical protein